mgnify:CR=1 FL=1
MKKITLLGMALLASLTMQAQNFKLAHPTTKQFFKVIDPWDVFRKSPNPKSEKMLIWYENAESPESRAIPFYQSENRGRYKENSRTGTFIKDANPDREELLPMYGRTGNWIKVLFTVHYPIPRGESLMGYIPASHGKVCNLADGINLADLEEFVAEPNGDFYFPGYRLYSRKGKYSDRPFMAYVTSDMDRHKYIEIAFPKVFENKYMCVTSISMLPEYVSSASEGRIRFDRRHDGEYYWQNHAIYLNSRSSDNKHLVETAINTILNISDAEFANLFKYVYDEPEDDIIAACYAKTTTGEVVQLDTTINGQYLKVYPYNF